MENGLIGENFDYIFLLIFWVVGGLMSFPFTYRNYIYNANNDILPGYYRGTSENSNTPGNYGVLIVFNALGYIVQMFIDTSNVSLKIRVSIDNGISWKDWI